MQDDLDTPTRGHWLLRAGLGFAALLATVTGLAVAIPALFGYNYLLTRSKNITANMMVFVDEFVARVSEYYRPAPERALAAE